MQSRILLNCITALVLVCGNSVTVQAQDTQTAPNEIRANRAVLEKNASAAGIIKTDVPDAIINDMYTDEKTGITFMYVQQAYQGIKVYNSIVSIALKNGMVTSHSGEFIPGLTGKIRSVAASKTPVDAVTVAVKHLGLRARGGFTMVEDRFAKTKTYKVGRAGIAKKDIETTLIYLPSADRSSVRLVWNVNIDVEGSSDWWNVRIDAATGEYIEKDNQTVYEHQEQHAPAQPDSLSETIFNNQGNALNSPSVMSTVVNNPAVISPAANSPAPTADAPPNVTSASYRVIPFPFESPLSGTFTDVSNPWTLAGAGNNATTHGWHFDGTNNYGITRGNNVFAFLDYGNSNEPDAVRNYPDTSTTAAPSLTFRNIFDPVAQPNQVNASKKAALDNLFYWNNLSHDITYQYGFTEAAGNFQADNLGRGGLAGDAVSANAQDHGGYSNANFGTGADGSVGRMQMYLWNNYTILNMTSPAVMSNVPAYENGFLAPNKLAELGPLSGEVVQYDLDPARMSGCAASTDPSRLAGKIALISGTSSCEYILRVKNAQVAGAIGVLIYSTNLTGMIGLDSSVTIPAVSITTTFANTIVSYINGGSPVNIYMEGTLRMDGDFDNSIVVHEYGHGVSLRLTGGPSNGSCLNNNEQAGEGWSDYLALMTTTDWSNTALTAGATPRTIGNYALGQTSAGRGIRRYPYTTNMGVNPLTYSNLSSNPLVHAIGEVWCSALWDMTWNIIQQTNQIEPDIYKSGSTAGNTIALNLVITAMKLQPCSPGFLDSRDAILRADSILYNYEHKCAIWNAFARRGMGSSAAQGYSTSAIDQTAAFDLPVGLRLTGSNALRFPLSAEPTITQTVSCDCAAVTNQVIRDTLPAGLTFVSSIPAGATVSGNVVSFPATSFAAGESKTFSIKVATASTGCTTLTPLNDNRDGSTTGNLVSNGWASSSARSFSASNSWFGRSQLYPTQYTLTSPVMTAAAGSTMSILSYWHFYNTEKFYDGGVVEYSTDGSSWLDASPFFITGRYTPGNISGTGRPGFTGSNFAFERMLIDLSSFGSTPIQVRFRSFSDDGVAVEGWYVDDILKMDGCGGLLKAGVYNNSGSLVNSLITPVFIDPGAVLPVTWLDFTATGIGKQVSLEWKVTNEVNVSHYEVEYSATGRDFVKLAGISATAAADGDKTYSQVHRSPVAGGNYYRIRQVDIDGHSSYSSTRLVRMDQAGEISISPNPVLSSTRIQSPVVIKTIQLYSPSGQLLRQVSPMVKTYDIDLSKYPAGVYSVRIDTGEKVVTQKLVKQ